MWQYNLRTITQERVTHKMELRLIVSTLKMRSSSCSWSTIACTKRISSFINWVYASNTAISSLYLYPPPYSSSSSSSSSSSLYLTLRLARHVVLEKACIFRGVEVGGMQVAPPPWDVWTDGLRETAVVGWGGKSSEFEQVHLGKCFNMGIKLGNGIGIDRVEGDKGSVYGEGYDYSKLEYFEIRYKIQNLNIYVPPSLIIIVRTNIRVYLDRKICGGFEIYSNKFTKFI